MSPSTPPVSEPRDGRGESSESVDVRRQIRASLDALTAPPVTSTPEVSAS